MTLSARRTQGAGAIAALAIFAGCLATSPAPAQAPPPNLINKTDPISFRGVVKSVLPAVVSVDAKSSRPGGRNRSMRPFSEEDSGSDNLRKFFDDLERRPTESPSTERSIGFGSGFLISDKGVILTNYHVIENAERVEITLFDGRKFTSSDIKGDKKTDLAIVRINPKGASLPFIEMGDSSQMEIGDRVLAIGAPFGLSGTVTHGIISAKGRDLDLNRYDDFLQTDAAINPGNSGGPLVSLDGKVVGINSAIKSGSGGFQGIGLAISSNLAKNVIEQLVRDGIVKRPYLGIELANAVSPDAATQLGIKDNGVVVARVTDKGPADKAGIRAEDAITAIDGKPIKSFKDLIKTIVNIPVGTTVNVDLLRDGRPITLKVKLEEEPKNYGAASPRRNRGITVEGDPIAVGRSGMAIANVANIEGVLVYSVERNSPAATAGLGSGMLIQKVNKSPVSKAAAVKEAIEAALAADEPVLLHVQAGNSVAIIVLKPK